MFSILKKIDFQDDRLSRIITQFQRFFPGDKPAIFRAPGRVNLLGEHTDYNGLPVLPMAIDLDIMMVCGFRHDHRICLKSSSGYPDREFDISESIPKSPPGAWDNYIKAAAQALQRWVRKSGKSKNLNGFNAIVDGNIPAGSGLSSSAALVVCSALVLNELNALKLTKHQLADITARGERYVGTQGGGMDQTISLFGKQGCALLIDFFPIRIQPVPVPDDHSIVVCNSLVVAKKSISKCGSYNRRTVECRLGVAMINHSLGKTSTNPLRLLGDVKVKEMESFIDKVFGQNVYSIPEISRYYGPSEENIVKECLTLDDGSIFNDMNPLFKVRNRCRHVLLEGKRVREGKDQLRLGNMEKFGRLMNESHASCDQDYEVSSPELNALVSICREAGAIGSRLTGAGFGGCTVSIIPKRHVNAFLKKIDTEYYQKYLQLERPDIYRKLDGSQKHIFRFKPSRGAGRIL